MSAATTEPNTRPDEDRADFSRDDVLDVLSNRRRRFAIHYLKHHRSEEVSLRQLAERVASWENEKAVAELDHRERKRVVNALRQFHLPKMADHGVVDYEPRRGTIRLTEAAASTEFYVDVLPERGVPWGLYYLGLAGLSVVCLVGLWLAVPPFTALPPLAWETFFVTALSVSALGHFYDNYYRMRLGVSETPSEVDGP